MKIALIKTGALGDVVRTTCLLPGLHRRAPGARVTWITARPALPLIVGHPAVACAATIDDAPRSGWRAAAYDWVISLDDEPGSCALAGALSASRLSGAFLGVDGLRRYSADLAGWFGMGLLRPDAEGGLEAANGRKKANRATFGQILYAGLDLPGPVAAPSLPIPRSAHVRAGAWLHSQPGHPAPVVGVNAGSGARWEVKRWPVRHAAALAGRLAAAGLRVVVLGGPDERCRNVEICRSAMHPLVAAGPDWFDVLSFAALIARCAVLVTTDSLALHLAIAVGTPVVALFGPTSDSEIDLNDRGTALTAPVPCGRCYRPTCDIRPTCMDLVTPADVHARVWKQITDPQTRRRRSGD